MLIWSGGPTSQVGCGSLTRSKNGPDTGGAANSRPHLITLRKLTLADLFANPNFNGPGHPLQTWISTLGFGGNLS